MTYVYRDPRRWRPGHEPEETPIEPTSERPRPPLPEPLWGGPLGLALAVAEVHAWERLHPEKQRREKGKH